MTTKLMSLFCMCLALIGFVAADTGCFGGMMSGSYINPFAWIVQLLVIIVLTLLAVWLWKQIQNTDKKKS